MSYGIIEKTLGENGIMEKKISVLKNLFDEIATPYVTWTNRGDKKSNKKDKNLDEKPKEQSIKIYITKHHFLNNVYNYQ